MKKIKIIIACLLFIWLSSCNNTENVKLENNKKDKIEISEKESLIFALPFAPVSYPVIKMVDSWVIEKMWRKWELIFWDTPEKLKGFIAGKQADFFAVPSNTAATFYNKGFDIKLLNISIWNALWLVSTDKNKKTISDFKGETIAMAYKWNMPHLLFNELVKKEWLDPEKDFKLDYVSTPLDAVKRLIIWSVDNAFLIEPSVSTVIVKSKEWQPDNNPTIYRSLDIQDEWGRLFNTNNEIPIAWMIASSRILNEKEIINNFIEEYKKAAEWCMSNPDETAKIVKKYIPQLNEKGIAEAMKNVVLKSVNAKDAKERLEWFYKILSDSKPALIGNKLPDENFYY